MKLDFDSATERRILANGLVVIDVLRIGQVPILRDTACDGVSALNAPV